MIVVHLLVHADWIFNMPSNRTIIDLGKVAYVDYYYANQYGDITPTLPSMDTLFGRAIDPADKILHSEETVLQRAKRLNRLDKWVAHCRMQLNNSHSITYTGDKAKSMYSAWCARIFGKENK